MTSAAKKMRELRKYRKENGLCITCGSINDTNKSRCTECQQKENHKSQLRRERRKKEGKCVQCGTVLDREGAYCKRCVTSLNQRTRKAKKNYVVKQND